jgi:hypothetical protein
MIMDNHLLESVLPQVYRRFPDFQGVVPKIRRQSAEAGKSLKQEAFLLTFQKAVITGNGATLGRWLRVVVSYQGKILKMTTSR